MDYLFCIKRKPSKGCPDLNEALITTISSNNVIAFTTQTEIDDNSIRSYGSHVYVADLNTPWLSHKILSNASLVTVLQWDSTGELLLVADESGFIQIYQMKEHLLNEWNLTWQTSLQGEHILSAAFFHSGKKTCLNPEKKDSLFYNEKFQNVKFACSVKQFGGRPATGALLLTSTGMLAAIIIPHYTSQAPMIVATESLGPTRIYIKTADICYGKNGHFLLAVSSGDISMPIQCYKVSVRKSEDKCVITSETLPSFFLSEGSKEVLMEVFLKDRRYADLLNLNWVMKEDADSLVVAVGNDSGSCLQVWELREKALPVHEVLVESGEPKFFNTVLWQFQCSFQYGHKVMSLATSKMTFLNTLSSSYIVVAFADNSIHCLYRDTLKSICNITLGTVPGDENLSKYSRSSHRIHTIDMSWLGNVLIVIDADSYIHVFKLPPQIDSTTPLSVPYATTMLEYCLMTGLDWLDLLLVLRSGMLDPLCDRFTESFNRQSSSIQQYYYIKYMCIKASLYRLSVQGQSKANDLIQYLMLHSIATSFKSLLRPSEQCSPGDSLSSVVTVEGQNDVDKVLMHLEAKEFTVEPSTLQSLQQLIQWISDLALNLLVKLPDSRPSVAKSYELLRDVKAINTLREMLVLIRIWGLLRPACLPVYNKSDLNLDVLALIFRLLSKLVQNVSEPEDSLIVGDLKLLRHVANMVESTAKHYEPNKIRSHPFRCITLPVCVVVLFIVYWFLFPPVYLLLYKGKPLNWKFCFTALAIFIVLLMILLLIWRFRSSTRTSERIMERKMEYNALVHESKLKALDDSECSASDFAGKSEAQDDDDDHESNQEQVDSEKDGFSAKEVLEADQPPSDDKIFLRCSTKRRKAPQNIEVVKVMSAERPATMSPTTREEFFRDMISSANLSLFQDTQDFIETEKSNYFGNFKPVKEETEYFIMNVNEASTCKTEAFLVVENDPPLPEINVVVDLETGLKE